MGALPTYRTAPQVVHTRPLSAAQDVPRETVISATFNMPLDPTTITGDYFVVSGQGGGRSGSITYDPLTRTATFTPDAPFDPGETVTIELSENISNLWGVNMGIGSGWTFAVTTATAVETPDPLATPFEFALRQNYPNPFNAETQIRFALAAPGHVSLKVYNMMGQLVGTLLDRESEAGSHRIIWNGTDHEDRPLASGVYFCRLEAGGRQDVIKMMLLR